MLKLNVGHSLSCQTETVEEPIEEDAEAAEEPEKEAAEDEAEVEEEDEDKEKPKTKKVGRRYYLPGFILILINNGVSWLLAVFECLISFLQGGEDRVGLGTDERHQAHLAETS